MNKNDVGPSVPIRGEATDNTNESGIIDNKQAPVSCFHSVFSANYSDWKNSTVKTSSDEEWDECTLKDKITINDLKRGRDGILCMYKSEYKKSSPCIDFLKPEQIFDKSLARNRLKCPNCYFLTDNRGNLRQHMKVHLRPYLNKCKHCNFKTKYKSSLKSHMLRHERTKGRKKQKN